MTAQGMYYIEGQIQDKDFRYTKTTFEYVVTFKTSGEGEVVMYRALNLLLNKYRASKKLRFYETSNSSP